MSARDLVILARHIIDDFPEEYAYFSRDRVHLERHQASTTATRSSSSASASTG